MTKDIESSTKYPGTWQIDTVHSEVEFTVRHMMVSKVRGRFAEFSGTIVTAPDLMDSTVSVSIDPASVTTGNPQRDTHLRSPEFFGTDDHPHMDYRATGVVVDGDSYRLDGQLTIKGITRTVPVSFELIGMGPDAYGGTRMGFSGRAEINRQDFDVRWNHAIEGSGGVVVGDKVAITLEVQAVLQD